MTAVDTALAQPAELAGLDRAHRVQLALTSTDPDVLAALASDLKPDVRAGVARNRATPAAVLADLADDLSDKNRELVARHPATGPATLAKLTRDADLAVQESALVNPNTPGHALAAAAATGHERYEMCGGSSLLRSHAESLLRLAVARHPNTPAHTLTELSRDHVRLIVVHVAGNPNTPASTLASLCGRPTLVIREAAASNPNTPEKTLRELAAGHENGSAAGAAVRAARRELCRRTADTLTDPARDVATTLLTDWAGSDADLVATAEAIVRDDSSHRQAPHPAG